MFTIEHQRAAHTGLKGKRNTVGTQKNSAAEV